jgi:Secretion system C-terminal sorting domain
MKLLILNTFFLLFFHAILTAQPTQKEHYIGAFYMTDTRSTPDGGCLVAGLSDGDSIHVRRLNANLEPIFSTTFSVADSVAFLDQVVAVQAILLKDGSVVVVLNIFQCDIFTKSQILRIAPDGINILWHKKLDYGYREIFTGSDSTFIVSGYSVWPIAYDLNGDLVSFDFNLPWPNDRIPLSSDRYLNAVDDRVFLSNLQGYPIGLPWFSPEPIIRLDTIHGGGFVAFGKSDAYILSEMLNLIEIRPIPIALQDLKFITSKEGFVALVKQGIYENTIIKTYNPDFQEIAAYDLGRNLATKGNFFVDYANVDLLDVHSDRLIVVANHAILGSSNQVWLFSDTTGNSGAWSSTLDLAVTGIYFSGTPTGTAQINTSPPIMSTFYSANYTNVYVQVENKGMDTIQYCKISYFGGNSCYDNPFCESNAIRVTKEFGALNLAPNTSILLDFDTLTVFCSTQDLREICLTASEINHIRDNKDTNNRFCEYFPTLYVPTNEPALQRTRIAPNPATNIVSVTFDKVFEGTVAVISPLGTAVFQQQVSGAQVYQINLPELPSGNYFIRLQGNDGNTRVERLSIIR